jgi:hypothetical protein
LRSALLLLPLGLLLLRSALLLLPLGLLLLRSALLLLLLLFRGLGVLLVLVLLGVRGSKHSKKKEQNSRADKSNWFHEYYLHYGDLLCVSRASSRALLLLRSLISHRSPRCPLSNSVHRPGFLS